MWAYCLLDHCVCAPPVCVFVCAPPACAPHSPAHFVGCAACEAGLEPCAGVGSPHALRGRRSLPAAHRRMCVRAIAGLRDERRRALEPREARRRRLRTLTGTPLETHYSYTPSDARAVRARRGDDVRAERCLRVGREQAALWSVLGSHIAHFPLLVFTTS